MAGTRIIDARHRDGLQPPPTFFRTSVTLAPPPTTPSAGDQAINLPPQHWDAPSFMRGSPATAATVTQGMSPIQFMDARHREGLRRDNWLWGRGVPNTNLNTAPSAGNQVIIFKDLDYNDPGAVTLPGLITQLVPYGRQLVVPQLQQSQTPSFLRAFGGAGVAPTVTPPIGAQLTTVPPHNDIPFVWLRQWNGVFLPPLTRISAAGALVVQQPDRRDEPSFVFRGGGQPNPPPSLTPVPQGFLPVPPVEEHLPSVWHSSGWRPVQTVLMPNLIGMTLNDATNLIISLGGQVTGVVYEDVKYPLLRQERGIVLAQWPLPGTPVTAFAVFLVVSSGFVNYPDIGDSINQQVNTVIGSIH